MLEKYVTMYQFLYVALRYISDINECLTTDWCAHSGICTNHNGGFSCNCAGTGYEGDKCQTGKCYKHNLHSIYAYTQYTHTYIYQDYSKKNLLYLLSLYYY